jgi:hypothetical protein
MTGTGHQHIRETGLLEFVNAKNAPIIEGTRIKTRWVNRALP